MWLSDFKDERECLTYVPPMNSDNLLINDIITIHTNVKLNNKIVLNRHKQWLKCINFFQQICSGKSTNNCEYFNVILSYV